VLKDHANFWPLQVDTEANGETDAGVAFLNAFNYITSVKEEPYEALSFITDVYNKVGNYVVRFSEQFKAFQFY